jgi:hypothetical protein
MVAQVLAAESSPGEPMEERPTSFEIDSEVKPTNPRECLSDDLETKPVKRRFGKDVHPKAPARQRRVSSADKSSVRVCAASSGKDILPRALQRRAAVYDNASACSNISDLTANSNWTSVHEVSRRSSQQSEQKRNLEPTGLRRSLPNILELSETPKPVDHFNCRASMQVDAQRQPQVGKRQTEQEPCQKGHQPQVGGQRSSSRPYLVTHSSSQAAKVPSQPQQVRRGSQTGRIIFYGPSSSLFS